MLIILWIFTNIQWYNKINNFQIYKASFNCAVNFECIKNSRIYILNKTENVNLNVFNMITGINESKNVNFINFMVKNAI